MAAENTVVAALAARAASVTLSSAALGSSSGQATVADTAVVAQGEVAGAVVLVAAAHQTVMPTPVVVPEAEGEARRRCISGSGGDKRRKE